MPAMFLAVTISLRGLRSDRSHRNSSVGGKRTLPVHPGASCARDGSAMGLGPHSWSGATPMPASASTFRTSRSVWKKRLLDARTEMGPCTRPRRAAAIGRTSKNANSPRSLLGSNANHRRYCPLKSRTTFVSRQLAASSRPWRGRRRRACEVGTGAHSQTSGKSGELRGHRG
jgi:hypothetical protein